MTTFDNRKKASETRFVLDAEQEFKAGARRNKLLAQWAAPILGRDDVDAYIAEVIKSDFEEAGDDDVLRKVSADLEKVGSGIPEAELRAKMDDLMEVAREQIAAGE